MRSDFIRITDKTQNTIVIDSLQRKATLVQLGGFPIAVQGYPDTFWNPWGTLSHHREGGRVENAIIMKLRGRKKMCQTTEQPTKETPDLTQAFNDLLSKYGHDNEETADVAGIIAKEMGLYKGELQ